MTHELAIPFPANRRVVFEIRGGESDGDVFDSRSPDAAGGAMAGHLWFATAGAVEGRTFQGRSIAGSDRATRSPTGRSDEPYFAAEGRRFVVGHTTDDGETIRATLHDVTPPTGGGGLWPDRGIWQKP